MYGVLTANLNLNECMRKCCLGAQLTVDAAEVRFAFLRLREWHGRKTGLHKHSFSSERSCLPSRTALVSSSVLSSSSSTTVVEGLRQLTIDDGEEIRRGEERSGWQTVLPGSWSTRARSRGWGIACDRLETPARRTKDVAKTLDSLACLLIFPVGVLGPASSPGLEQNALREVARKEASARAPQQKSTDTMQAWQRQEGLQELHNTLPAAFMLNTKSPWTWTATFTRTCSRRIMAHVGLRAGCAEAPAAPRCCVWAQHRDHDSTSRVTNH
ncbi:hypothetical protein B0J14DRAFT_102504 [Halenospora varia]|nr:hypothetical protein B0J14DRAFT_102504 [Halenospora varia]